MSSPCRLVEIHEEVETRIRDGNTTWLEENAKKNSLVREFREEVFQRMTLT